jgi:hypothetical protein
MHPSNGHLLRDIKETYRWLENHKDDSELKNALVQSQADPLFLNVDDPETMEWTWHSADQLYIGLIDSPQSDCWGVRQFLAPFQGLLRLARVAEVKLPTAPDMHTSSAEIELSRMRSTYDSMRREHILTDMVFIADNGEEFPAHRIVLAGAAEYFRTMFSGAWGESNTAHPVPVPGCPADGLRQVLGK